MKTVAFLYLWFLYFGYTLCSPSQTSNMKNVTNVYEFLWENNADIANETIRLDFLIEMQNGSLQAERYINFTIQDINYVLNVTNMLKNLSVTVTRPSDLKTFFMDRYSSYNSFGKLMLQQYGFTSTPPIRQTPAMKQYLSYYRHLMMNEDPLYFAVGLLPCSRLWLWLADNLSTPPTNAYYTWKVENMEGNPEKHYKALLNKHLNTTAKVQKANVVFRAQMQHEHDFFYSS
ncbi:uncharacterized protein LOC122342536 [Puntigrus tetrazona]|uniref:uncharacterized protein LOC122342536 n=1 Tax=Puntigrus tetrazona TaxID=1606681 RepID=UPI001C8A825F|nr:uncharacterized protein LOC122342536 [Puntigrus tetrazona]